MMEFWESAILSNIVGICSLVIGFAGLIITVKAMRSAKRIEEDIKEAQSLALDKSRFRKYKEKASKSLNRKRKAVKEENTISYSLCNDVVSIINDLAGYENILSEKDLDNIHEQKQKLQEMASSINMSLNSENRVIEFDGIVAVIVSILSKGEYEL